MPIVLKMRRDLSGELSAPRWPSGVALAPFTVELAGEVERLLIAAYQKGGGEPRDYIGWFQRIAGDSEFEEELILLARELASGRVLGVCHLWNSSFVKDLAVVEGWRGKGVASALLRYACITMAERGETFLGLKVDEDNPHGAVEFYRRMGFESFSE